VSCESGIGRIGDVLSLGLEGVHAHTERISELDYTQDVVEEGMHPSVKARQCCLAALSIREGFLRARYHNVGAARFCGTKQRSSVMAKSP
jgi:hypothetical protein